MNDTANLVLTGESKSYFGYSVSPAGDVDGDGHPEIIVGAPIYDTTGRVYLYHFQTRATLNLSMFIEGFYDSLINSQVRDSITVELREQVSPYSIADAERTAVGTDGSASLEFNTLANQNYYVVLEHRNSVQTWSAVPLSISNNKINYDFTSASSQAFGSNQILVDSSPLRYAIYNGDVNQSGTVDLTDLILCFNDASHLVSGYVNTDLNGDNFVDITDVTIAFRNTNIFVHTITP